MDTTAHTTNASDDVRYVSCTDPRAILIASSFHKNGLLDLGGWTDGDRDAFEIAARDEAQRWEGYGISPEHAAEMEINIGPSDDVKSLVDETIEGLKDNDTVNDLGGDFSGWDADDAVRLYNWLSNAEEAARRGFRTDYSVPQIAEATARVVEWLAAQPAPALKAA